MSSIHTNKPSPAMLVRPLLAVAATLMLVACAGASAGSSRAQPASAQTSTSASGAATQGQLPTNCSAPTPAETEGPYFKAGSPDQTALAASGMPGTRLVLTGYVVDTNCRPVSGVLVDFWQADSAGQYDNSGYTLRGHQYTDDSGRYQLETVVPGLYPGRTRHIHVKVQAPGQPALTTQLYFPDEPSNTRDGIFRENGQALLLTTQPSTDGSINAGFNFILSLP